MTLTEIAVPSRLRGLDVPGRSYTLLGQWLEEERHARGHTWRQIAQTIRVGEHSLFSVMYGEQRPCRRVREAIAAYLNLEPEEIQLLLEVDADPGYYPRQKCGANLDGDVSRLAQEIDEAAYREGMILSEVAGVIGITPTSISRLRHRGAKMNPSTAHALSAFLGTTTDEVLAWSDEDPLPIVVYPLVTHVGTQWHPTLRADLAPGCERCRFRTPCHREVVERDGYAWCERVLDIDVDIDARVVSRNGKKYHEDPYEETDLGDAF